MLRGAKGADVLKLKNIKNINTNKPPMLRLTGFILIQRWEV